MTMPLAKIDLLFGYGLAFAAVAIVQTAVVCSVAIGVSRGSKSKAPCWSSRGACLFSTRCSA